ncbi:hypothetical protein FB45DRAFT_908507 [Roridomyces roridus]|uniref:Uncharacterized protein n=1 Tax=Roridomyces roridus TaxID=1738132 RepID=A0AAD7FSX2_9AGAR|nr:hypothetical protein FB45DRAFT_908507 [Roridomyces roridus]
MARRHEIHAPLFSQCLELLEDLPSPDQDTTIREFIPYLHLHSSSTLPADASVLPALPHTESWTHAVRILPASPEHPPNSQRVTQATSSRGRQLQILDLYVPAPAQNATVVPLCGRHILVARDFLALALPYYHPRANQLDLDPQPAARTDPVRVILSGPPRVVLTIALAYIAYAAGSSVAHVMRCVVDEAEDAEACALLGPDGTMGLAERELSILERLVKREL